MALERYRAKRDFHATPEPRGRKTRSDAGALYVIQKHAARRLHYDLRLELGGVFKSWAIAKGPSLVPGEKRLAVETEDHPLDYATFEGTIPKGEYGGGRVIVWDRGRWMPVGNSPVADLRKGHLRFSVDGEKLSGCFDLVRLPPKVARKKVHWLLIKTKDEHARAAEDPDILDERPKSVMSGRRIEDLPEPEMSARPSARVSAPTARPGKAEPKLEPGGSDPLPDFVSPAFAVPAAKPPIDADWVHEVKYDGYRLQARLDHGRVRLSTRSGLDWTDRFRALSRLFVQLPATRAILDGELVVETEDGRSSFADLQVDLSEGREDRLKFYAFDLLHIDGMDLTGSPLEARKKRLRGLIDGAPAHLVYSEHFDSDGQVMKHHTCRLGFEGIVSKRRSAPYRSGRSGDWIKSKCAHRREFVVIGYVPSTVARHAVGSLALADREESGFVYVGRAGTGIDAKTAEHLKATLEPMRVDAPAARIPPGAETRGVRWVVPRLVAEIEFRARTQAEQLRHAAFRGLRLDKTPDDVEPEEDAMGEKQSRRRGKTRASKGAGSIEAQAAPAIHLTHADRPYWPQAGITKQGLADYYAAIWPHIAPHVVDRPLAFLRCPDGIEGSCFFQKHAWAGLDTKLVTKHQVGDDAVLAIHDVDGLIALAQAGVLEIHPWGSWLADPERPERLVFDLDPGEGIAFSEIERAALDLREELAGQGLSSYVKTSGGKGLHVVVPLVPSADWEVARSFAKSIAEDMAKRSPERFTAKLAKAARRKRIFIDYLRNGRGATAVAAFSPRARAGAPVSTPLMWEEFGQGLSPGQFTIVTIFRRLVAFERDPWDGFEAARRKLPSP